MGKQWRRDCRKWLEESGLSHRVIIKAINVKEIEVAEPNEEQVKKYVAEKYKDGVRVVPWVMPDPIQDPSVKA